MKIYFICYNSTANFISWNPIHQGRIYNEKNDLCLWKCNKWNNFQLYQIKNKVNSWFLPFQYPQMYKRNLNKWKNSQIWPCRLLKDYIVVTIWHDIIHVWSLSECSQECRINPKYFPTQPCLLYLRLIIYRV